LLARLRTLLSAHEESQGPLDRGPAAPSVTTDLAHPEAPGTIIGSYKLIEEIGEGGMGAVWMAQQTEPVKRLVALKLIKAGMDSRQVIARFEAERQALALMDHTNIARVLEAGTTAAGRPYFVMDLVKGVPITRYCDEHHLTLRQRLELFIPVCQAVQHAHQKGIIHRDLKPSNVLVALYDGQPVPKVIDFGVAKAAGQQLTDKTLVTGFGAIVGTPEYMSPEQAQLDNLDIDTRSDIYSLGVLRYELLTGTTPFTKKDLEKSGLLETLRMIREQEPPKPSTKLSTAAGLPTLAANRGTEPAKLRKLVRGELDWIVMKALEKDRNRRYETANGFARDVERYLADEPVQACPPSAGYRLRKFARRNRGPVLAASLLVLVLVVGIIGTTWGMLRANRAEAEAVNEAVQKTQALVDKEAALEAARGSERGKTRQLALSYFKEAQAWQNSGLVGRRFDSLEALKKAAEQFRALGELDEQRTVELRNQAIACLVLADLKPDKKRTPGPGWSRPNNFHPTLQYYAVRSVADDHPVKGDIHLGVLSVRRVPDDREVALLPGFGVRVVATRFSPDDRYLAAHYEWQNISHSYVWDVSRREPILKESLGGFAGMPAFSPDIRLVALPLSDKSIRIYELPSGAKWKDLPPGIPVGFVQFHPDGRRLSVVSSNIVQLRELESGNELATFKHPSDVYALAWRDDGRVLATGCYDHDVYLWEVANPAQPLRILKGHFGAVENLTFSHGGDLLFSNSWDSTDRLWDPMTGQQLVSRPGGVYREYLFRADDQALDDGWQVATGRECRTFHGQKKPPFRVTICPSGPFRGRLMASFSEDGMRLWDLAATREGDKLLDTLRVGESMQVHIHPTGESLITDSKRVGLQRWPITPDHQTGGLRIGPPQSLGLSARAPFFGYDHDFALSADGRTVAHCPNPGQAILYDLENPRRKLLIESPRLRHAAFSPDGRWLATGNWQGRGAKVWDAQTGKPEADLDLGESDHARVAFSPDGKWLVTGTVAEYRFWEVGSWHKKHGLPRVNAGDTAGMLVFSPDAKMLAVLHNMTEVRLLDPASGREFAHLPTRGFPCCFSPDGSQLVAHAGREGAIHVWDLRLIRRQLAEMGLDWDLPPYPPPLSESAKPLRVQVLLAEPPLPSAELDAQAYLERGLLYVRLRRYWEADADFDRARRLDPKRPNWEEIIRSYSQAIDLQPNDTALWSKRGFLYTQMGLNDKAVADFAKAIDLKPDDGGSWYEMALAHSRLGQWEQASAAYEHTTTLKPDSSFAWYCLALVKLQRGDRAAYQNTCVRMLKQFGESPYANDAHWTAWTCVLAPDAVADWTKPLQLAERAHAEDRSSVLYRAGRFEEAGQRLAEAEAAFQQSPSKSSTIVYNRLFLAMAHHRLGHAEEAASWLKKVVKEIDEPSPITAQDPATKLWNHQLTLRLLRREAEELLGKKSP
jgi:serine/threonine protein kinase/WD40 repeat protein/tetratricopeptide (TPR) repeat protein